MSTGEKIRVMIAHRNPLVCAGLEAAFRIEGDFDVATRDADLSGAASEQVVDVTVSDYETGCALLIDTGRRACGVLIVTDDLSEASIRRAVELGARGYLLLSSSLASVVAGARCIHDGGTTLDPTVTAKMIASLTRTPLTRRETEVLRLIMTGLSDKAIANSLGLKLGTAKSHVKAIREKLDAKTRTQAVAVAHRRGLVNEAAHAAP